MVAFKDLSNYEPYDGVLPEAFPEAGDGYSLSPSVGDRPTDGLVAPEAKKIIQDFRLVLIRKEKGIKEWRFDKNPAHQKQCCCIHIPVSNKVGNLTLTQFWIGNAVYLREDVFETLRDYPDYIEFGKKIFRKAYPRRIKYGMCVEMAEEKDKNSKAQAPEQDVRGSRMEEQGEKLGTRNTSRNMRRSSPASEGGKKR